MERFGHIRRHGTPGSKKALYGPSQDFTAIMAKHSALLGDLGRLFRRSAATVAAPEVATRLEELSDFHLAVGDAMGEVVERVRATRDATSA